MIRSPPMFQTGEEGIYLSAVEFLTLSDLSLGISRLVCHETLAPFPCQYDWFGCDWLLLQVGYFTYAEFLEDSVYYVEQQWDVVFHNS